MKCIIVIRGVLDIEFFNIVQLLKRQLEERGVLKRKTCLYLPHYLQTIRRLKLSGWTRKWRWTNTSYLWNTHSSTGLYLIVIGKRSLIITL